MVAQYNESLWNVVMILFPWEQQESEDGFLGKYTTFLSSWRATEMSYSLQDAIELGGKKTPSVCTRW